VIPDVWKSLVFFKASCQLTVPAASREAAEYWR
jgi:hypothetical protein